MLIARFTDLHYERGGGIMVVSLVQVQFLAIFQLQKYIQYMIAL